MDATPALPNYTLQTKLHESPARALYRGVRDQDGAPVVFKIPRHENPQPRELAELRHEFTVLRSIEWPGVVKAHTLEPFGASLALVLEDIRGESLADRIRSGPIDVPLALSIARSLAAILEGIHGSGIIHKDIKPSNILLREGTESVVLIDFGIATSLPQESQADGRADVIQGTPAYISPEQTGRMNRALDYRTDFYSLGVTLYEMLTGVLPFESNDPVELVHSHIARTPAAPHERDPKIPEVLSRIVMKLLAKVAEDRYQHARGLILDLDECIALVEAGGAMANFPLGRRDISPDLRISQKLYGREDEEEALLSTFERVSRGGSELFLVTGAAGVGKSVLVHEVHKAIARSGGEFIAGKFDQLQRGVPFSAFTQAFRGLVRRALGEPPAKLAERKRSLLAALGINGQLLINRIPELELILGPQRAIAAIGPMEAQNRLGLVLQSFVQVFCKPSHPLVIFLDDLQWADVASLWLLRLLMMDTSGGHLLLVGAYRDGEVDQTHPLQKNLDDLREQGVRVTTITLDPLDPPASRRLLADTLKESADSARIRALADHVTAKTRGNPFFISQFLGALHRSKLLRMDPTESRWVWDDAAIASAPVTDNVVDFMAARLEELDASTQRLLSLAACIGHHFDLGTLAMIAELSRASAAAALWPALQEGLVVPLGSDYLLLPTQQLPEDHPPQSTFDFDVSYRFLHDRVQQAAYRLIGAKFQAEVHLRIGRHLIKALSSEPRGEALFEVVHHLNAGAALISERSERVELARLNLSAGNVAKSAAAFAEAAAFCGAGASMLDETSWEELYDLTFAIRCEQAECEYSAGHFDQAAGLIDDLLVHTRLKWQRGKVYGLRLELHKSQGQFAEALAAAAEGLALFGVDLPKTPAEAQGAFMAELAAVERSLATRTVESLADLPILTDRETQASIQLILDATLPAFSVAQHLYPFMSAKLVNLSLAHGNFRHSPRIYTTFGFLVAGVMGRYAQGMPFGKLGLGLIEKVEAQSTAQTAIFAFALMAPSGMRMRDVLPYFVQVQQLGREYGDLVFESAGYSIFSITQFRLGEPLGAVRAEVQRGLAIMKRTKDAMQTGYLIVVQQVCACLQGSTRGPTSLSDDAFDEVTWVPDAAKIVAVQNLYFLWKMQILFLLEDYAAAYALMDSAEQTLVGSMGQHWVSDFQFYASLVLAALYPEASADDQRRFQGLLAGHLAALTALADACPENTRHQQHLVAAEIARIEGRPAEAMVSYEHAIELAYENGFPHHEALAQELYAKFHLARGQIRVARVYFTDACERYARWEATVKVKQLKGKYPLLSAISEPLLMREPESAVVVGKTTGSFELLDVKAALRAAQAISSEIVLDRIIYRMMRIVLTNAGAQRGCMILNQQDGLKVQAVIRVDPDTVEMGLGVPLASRADLAQSIIQFVARTGEPVMIGDACRDPRFAGDPYVARERLKSVLCIALVHHGRSRGVLYLENNAAEDAFPQDRLEILQMLCAQTAIAVENALLYLHVQDVSAELQEVNRHLEQEVAERTEDLRSANEDLQRRTDDLHLTNERLQHELAERENAERSRAQLHGQMIQMQQAMLEELSTPLIPITKQVMVLPLIGTMDARRAERMLETVLQGAQRHRAHTVIIDITGLKQVDEYVAGVLIRAAGALRLLGAEAMLTGMRPEVAQMLVGMGVTLDTLVTRATLESGIAHAIGRVRRPVS